MLRIFPTHHPSGFLGKVTGPLTYQIELESGTVVRRHVRYLRVLSHHQWTPQPRDHQWTLLLSHQETCIHQTLTN